MTMSLRSCFRREAFPKLQDVPHPSTSCQRDVSTWHPCSLLSSVKSAVNSHVVRYNYTGCHVFFLYDLHSAFPDSQILLLTYHSNRRHRRQTSSSTALMLLANRPSLPQFSQIVVLFTLSSSARNASPVVTSSSVRSLHVLTL